LRSAEHLFAPGAEIDTDDRADTSDA